MSKQALIIHKFGGSSLANSARFVAVKNLLQAKQEAIVVSAVKDTTSTLQSLLDLAAEQASWQDKLASLAAVHLALIKELVSETEQASLIQTIEQDIATLATILNTVQVIGTDAEAIQHVVLGYGEQWSAKILTAYLSRFAKVIYIDAALYLFITKRNGMVLVDWEKSANKLNQFLAHQTYDQLVITGFIAADEKGKRTILGRNGSDFSAAIFAKLLQAKELIIWTDVDGIFTADPSKVRAASAIESLSYKEALELAYFGAKVLHPMTIAPLQEANIPLYIKNSLRPTQPGTYISEKASCSRYLIKGLSSRDDVALINIEGAGMIGVSGIAARVFTLLQQINISVILISQASSEYSICFAIEAQASKRALEFLQEHLSWEIDRHRIEKIYVVSDCAILAVVGDEMVGQVGISGKLFATLAKANINIRAIAQGSSERNISVVISKNEVNKALQAVHASFYLSLKTISIGLIGPGLVGQALLKQLDAVRTSLALTSHVHLCVRGIMNSKKMLLDPQEINLATWQHGLNETQTPADLDEFAAHILADDVPHALIIDCTANVNIAQRYADLLQKGIHVITPNKHANSGDEAYYHQLKSLVRAQNRFYFYEATVCAGLPIINTLQDLIKTGDEVLCIEGVVSGTLSYIFNELAMGKTFAECVLAAKKAGYTEPDPREDLSGKDVARKLVCLARELGYSVSMDQVQIHSLVPPALQDCSVEEFLQRLPEYEAEHNEMFAMAQAKQQHLCYAGTIQAGGTVEVAIKAVAADHPFTQLKGTDNMIVFHTRRYHQRPLIIQGPGAGAEVTAAGIFADVLRLVASLA